MPSGRGSAARVRAVSTLLCESPCGRRLELPQQELFIGGPGLTNSDGFTLHGIDGPAVIDVRPGRSGLRVLGWVAAMVGAAGLVAGATTMSFGDEDRAVLRAGGITLGVAIPVLVLGGILVATGRTRASVRAKTRAE